MMLIQFCVLHIRLLSKIDWFILAHKLPHLPQAKSQNYFQHCRATLNYCPREEMATIHLVDVNHAKVYVQPTGPPANIFFASSFIREGVKKIDFF